MNFLGLPLFLLGSSFCSIASISFCIILLSSDLSTSLLVSNCPNVNVKLVLLVSWLSNNTSSLSLSFSLSTLLLLSSSLLSSLVTVSLLSSLSLLLCLSLITWSLTLCLSCSSIITSLFISFLTSLFSLTSPSSFSVSFTLFLSSSVIIAALISLLITLSICLIVLWTDWILIGCSILFELELIKFFIRSINSSILNPPLWLILIFSLIPSIILFTISSFSISCLALM